MQLKNRGRGEIYWEYWHAIGRPEVINLIRLAFPSWPQCLSGFPTLTPEMLKLASLEETKMYLDDLGWAAIKVIDSQNLVIQLSPTAAEQTKLLRLLAESIAGLLINVNDMDRTITIHRTEQAPSFFNILQGFLCRIDYDLVRTIAAGFTTKMLTTWLQEAETIVIEQIGGYPATYYALVDASKTTL